VAARRTLTDPLGRNPRSEKDHHAAILPWSKVRESAAPIKTHFFAPGVSADCPSGDACGKWVTNPVGKTASNDVRSTSVSKVTRIRLETRAVELQIIHAKKFVCGFVAKPSR